MLATVRRCGCMLLICASAARGQSFVNWETAPVHPLDMTPDGTKLLLANTADNRLEIFSLASGTPVWTASVPVGLDPVSVRARTNTEAWVANFISDTVSIVNLTTLNVITTLSVGDEPADVAFTTTTQKAFVSVSGLNHLKVYDLTNLAASPTILPIAGHRPRALASDGVIVYAAVFFSGNRSTVINSSAVSDPSGPAGGLNPDPNTSGTAFNPPIGAGLPTPPPVGLIVNLETVGGVKHFTDEGGRFWDSKVAWQLNHHAVAIVYANLDISYGPQTGNIQFALAVNPSTHTVFSVQDYLRNEHRFEEAVDRQFPHFLLSQLDTKGTVLSTVELNQHLFANPPIPIYKTTATPAERALSISDPRGIVWKDSTNCYVSGMGSNNVIRTNSSGARLATITVGQGPTGLAYDGPRSRLYCYNRFDATLSSISTAGANADTVVATIPFFDPTPAMIKTGRPLQYDAHQFSQLGIASCNSCHVDGKTDMQAWDVGDPAAPLAVFNETCSTVPGAGPCNDWHPMKGPLLTQTLQGIIGNGPMHWRGDRHDIFAFTSGFIGFLGVSAPTNQQMQQLGQFINTIKFPPQPYRTIIDGLPASVPGYSGTPANGAALFYGLSINGSQFQCLTCHSLPTGGGLTIIPPNLLGISQGFKTPQLRDLYTKTGFSKTSLSNNRGYGYSHDGSFESIFEFLQGHFVTYPNNASGDGQRRDLEAFLVSFPTDTHPAVGAQITIDAINKNDPSVISLLGTTTSLADSGSVGLVAKGVVSGQPRGYVYLAGTGNCQSDRKSQVVSVATLRTGAAGGAEITFTVVPAGTQTRIGIDRDEDGWYDRDELDLSTNPADPNSKPADSDGDGVADAVDLCPNTIPGSPVDSTGCPPVIFGDFDHDGDVDASDLAAFRICAGYAGVPHSGTATCMSVDWEHDGDVDPDDYGIFQRCYSGANHPAIPSCSN